MPDHSISESRRHSVEAVVFQTQPYQHREKENSDQRGGRHDKPTCNHCDRLGHSGEGCFEIIGNPPGWRKGARDGSKKGEQKMTPRVANVEMQSSPIPRLTSE